MPSPTRIRFINHAGYVLESGAVRLAVDPWIEGRAFNQSWQLLSDSAFTYEDFREVTHIWFSHEHPDHFVPPNLKKIPEDLRRRITVLYQTSRDRRVVDWCRANGFGQVVELVPDQPLQLSQDVEVLCCPAHGGDSWLLTRTHDLSILNMNDCLIRDAASCERVRSRVGRIDVLLTQFSIASWDGNPEDVARREQGARKMLEQAILQTNVLAPRFVVPFASFVRFCHDDNVFMNSAANRVGVAADALAAETAATPVVLYPGDVWAPGEAHANESALARYEQDYERAASAPCAPCAPTTEAQLFEAAAAFQKMLAGPAGNFRLRLSLARQTNHRSRAREGSRAPIERLRRMLALATLRVDRARIHLHDLGQSYCFDPIRGLHHCDVPPEACDIVTSADALCYAFRMMWGGETMLIAGTFREVRPGSRRILFDTFDMAKGLSLGDRLLWRNVPRRLLRRLWSKGEARRTAR